MVHLRLFMVQKDSMLKSEISAWKSHKIIKFSYVLEQ